MKIRTFELSEKRTFHLVHPKTEKVLTKIETTMSLPDLRDWVINRIKQSGLEAYRRNKHGIIATVKVSGMYRMESLQLVEVV